jgi:(2Fe-2S) ferredoxin
MSEPIYRANVLVCAGTSCESSGSRGTLAAMQAEVVRRGLQDEVRVVETGCRGFCAMGPVMIVYPEGIFYCQVKPSDVAEIVEETLVKGRVVQRLVYEAPETQQVVPFYEDIPFYSKQQRITLRNCGVIDPESIDEYIARGGYEALGKVLA